LSDFNVQTRGPQDRLPQPQLDACFHRYRFDCVDAKEDRSAASPKSALAPPVVIDLCTSASDSDAMHDEDDDGDKEVEMSGMRHASILCHKF
jgi:hypothetical protein